MNDRIKHIINLIQNRNIDEVAGHYMPRRQIAKGHKAIADVLDVPKSTVKKEIGHKFKKKSTTMLGSPTTPGHHMAIDAANTELGGYDKWRGEKHTDHQVTDAAAAADHAMKTKRARFARPERDDAAKKFSAMVQRDTAKERGYNKPFHKSTRK